MDDRSKSKQQLLEDITERKRAEGALRKAHDELEQRVEERTAELAKANEALRQVSERLLLATRTASVGIWDLDIVNNKLVWDDSMFRLYGISPKDFAGAYEAWQGSIHPDDLARAEAEVQLALRGEKEFDTEFRVVWPDKSVRWIKAHATVRRDDSGKPVRMLGTNWDITERERAEEALRQSEERYRELIDNQGEGLGRVDCQDYFTFANPAGERVFGVPHGGLVGHSLREFTSDEQYALVLEQTKKRQAREKATYEIEIIRPDGETRNLLVTAVPRIDKSGMVTGTLGLFFDITERKRAEKKLAEQHRTLKYLLQSSDHERQLIAYEIHDGLAQQLAGAIMQFQVFDHLKDKEPQEAAKAYDAGFAMLRQGHFETRRLIAGVRPPILDESGVVEAIAHLIHEQNYEKGPKIEYLSKVDFDRLVPVLENAIYRICQEALTNACRHSKSEKVRLSLTQREDRIRIEIRDWGIGFDRKTIRKNRYGLEGIRQRARLLGGKCGIRSKSGQGTRILVELPVMESKEDE